MARHGTWRTGILARECIDDHAQIDVSLKELRTVSRRLGAFATPYADELRVLERIYYKGKHQHRAALFWRKVAEVRRLGARIAETAIPELVDGVRHSCYGAEGRSDPKALRGAWKCTPDVRTCTRILDRLRSACVLVDRARSRFCLAYRTFARQLQTAAFLPLIVSLVAITSRLAFLVADLRSSIVLSWHAVMRILDAIPGRHTPTASRLRVLSLPADPGSGTRRVAPRTVDPSAEDLGSTVPRESADGSASRSGDRLSFSVPIPPVPPVAEECSHHATDDMPTRPGATSGARSPRPEHGGADASGRAPAKKRNPQTRDEIDEIFGF